MTAFFCNEVTSMTENSSLGTEGAGKQRYLQATYRNCWPWYSLPTSIGQTIIGPKLNQIEVWFPACTVVLDIGIYNPNCNGHTSCNLIFCLSWILCITHAQWNSLTWFHSAWNSKAPSRNSDVFSMKCASMEYQ